MEGGLYLQMEAQVLEQRAVLALGHSGLLLGQDMELVSLVERAAACR